MKRLTLLAALCLVTACGMDSRPPPAPTPASQPSGDLFAHVVIGDGAVFTGIDVHGASIYNEVPGDYYPENLFLPLGSDLHLAWYVQGLGCVASMEIPSSNITDLEILSIDVDPEYPEFDRVIFTAKVAISNEPATFHNEECLQ